LSIILVEKSLVKLTIVMGDKIYVVYFVLFLVAFYYYKFV